MTTTVEPYALCLGEILIDFTSNGTTSVGAPLYEQNAGGAPANVACALARLGSKAYFCGRVGQDMFGSYLKGVLHKEGIDPRHVVEDSSVPTTLAFVSLQQNGEREFAFVRNPGADTRLEYQDIPLELLRDAAVFHFGTLSLTHEPAASALRKAVAFATENGITTSIDVNLRPPLWSDLNRAYAGIHSILPHCDIVKMSYDELAFAIEGSDKGAVVLAETLLKRYPRVLLLAITLGASGSHIFYRKKAGGNFANAFVPAHRVSVIDTTGAGDSFVAGLLHSILKHGSFSEFLASADTVRQATEFASIAAALCATKRGAIPAMPYAEEVNGLIKTPLG